ncbi:hypothetical protein GLOIN_2v1787626 [Rhizophagus irregularis DAOM 181602=DAOM 197198]|uniref:BZIP domain-containing protein n=2 Tax=Rhizophagus irregularis TaxID=588596 RepID=A0A015K7F0_RHIIW|nr:hypothetical protein GLOIN_2v1787626 [Rhizophagus irregularis DAOM 181602=DAOM 197198]EXX63434.1 hypothetical protein RirG_152400 [Rhizophagus irregularis DAOM 197198w]POG60622.1 hypothetical protein GLOIN_2v1787626 [Rhizophagus irregularis DAOM 181602=DAOM 197198]GET66685.1 hypothetical protein GLOIN_2v1787626 [Rhizophagus irregularis DAOM 181602=DAOM 197198]|eukprot:XP_025167488.1 hypothetical protein GLOIN_2v1787626 [Rhizophagus irregularis DAOM 181602=DAOM 197198]
MGCRRSKTSQKKSQARFKNLKAARKSQLRQLEDQVQTFQSENDSLQAKNNSLQKEVAILTEFGVLQSVQIHQQEEEAQSNNELWAIAQKECWEAQKKVIQQDEEIVGLKGEVKQLKRENKSAMYSTKYFENKYYHAMSVIQKYGMIVVDDNMPKSPSPILSSSSSSFSSSSYDQIFVADGPDYINDNNNNNNVDNNINNEQ